MRDATRLEGIPVIKDIRLEKESTKNPSRKLVHKSHHVPKIIHGKCLNDKVVLYPVDGQVFIVLYEPFPLRLPTTSNVHFNTLRFQKLRSTSVFFQYHTFYRASHDECCRHANADQDNGPCAEEQNSKYQLKRTAIGPDAFPPQVHLVIVVVCVILDGVAVVAVMMNFSLFRVVVIIGRR